MGNKEWKCIISIEEDLGTDLNSFVFLHIPFMSFTWDFGTCESLTKNLNWEGFYGPNKHVKINKWVADCIKVTDTRNFSAHSANLIGLCMIQWYDLMWCVNAWDGVALNMAKLLRDPEHCLCRGWHMMSQSHCFMSIWSQISKLNFPGELKIVDKILKYLITVIYPFFPIIL